MIRIMFAITALFLFIGGCADVTEERHPNIILIIIDTLCADHLSCYDYHRNTSPVIDSLASEGIMYARMQAQAPWTLPAMVTIYTGLTEKSHGCNNYGSYSCGLDPELPTIVTILHEEGFTTAGFVNINYLGSIFGMEKGFEHFMINDEGHGRAAETVDEFISWLDSEEFSEPYFVVFHLFDPHLPYDAPMGFDKTYSEYGTVGITEWILDENGVFDPDQADHLRNLYDGEINWTDSQLSRMFGTIRERHLAENTLIIFTADHGEEFLEHGAGGHSTNLYQQSLH
ncbi:MAG: sulfatase, partial [Candidatus Aegiribacteria sp.]|nr:sulfatase [Candidatus Aegiribacteria sp.]